MTERVPPGVTRWAEAHAASARRGPRRLQQPGAPGGPDVAPHGRRVRLYGTPRERYSFGARDAAGPWAVSSVAWSPDGRSLAACGDGGWLTRWDLDAGATPQGFERDSVFRAYAVGWVTTADGRTLLLSDGPGFTVQVWDPATRTLLRTLTGQESPVYAVAGTTLPDGRTVVASGGEDDVVRVWDVHTGEPVGALTGVVPGVRELAWRVTDDGRVLLAMASRDGEVRIWDGAPDGRHVWGLGDRGLLGLMGAAWATAPDGRTLLAAVGESAARIWDVESGRVLRVLNTGHRMVAGVSWYVGGPGQLLLATGSFDATLQVWDAETGTQLLHLRHDADVNAVAFRQDPADGHLLLATACDDGGVRVFDVGEPAEPAAASAWSPARWRDPDAPRPLSVRLADPPFAVLEGHTDQVWTTARSDDGLLVTAGRDQVIRVWDVATRQAVRTLEGHAAIVRTLVTTRAPSGRSLLASGAYDGVVIVWDLDSGQRLATMQPQTETSLAASVMRLEWIVTGDGDTLLACGDVGNVLTVWDVSAGRELHTLTGHDGFVRGLAAFRAADGRSMLVSVSHDTTARVWDLATGRTVLTFTGHTLELICVCVVPGPDGSDLVASAGDEGTIRIWDPADGREVRAIAGYPPGDDTCVHDLAVARLPDGRPLLAASTQHGLLTVWDPWTGERLAETRRPGFAMGVSAGTPFRVGSDTVVELCVGNADDAVVWRAIVAGEDRFASAGEVPPLELVVPAAPDVELTGYDQRVFAVAWGPDRDGTGRRLLGTNGGTDSVPRLHDLASGAVVELRGHEAQVNALAWEPDGRGRVASAGNDGTVRLWDPADGTLLASLTGPDRPVVGLTWLAGPAGRTLLASVSFGQSVRIRDPDSGETVTVIERQHHPVRGIAGGTGPDGRVRLTVVERAGAGVIWDALTGERLGALAAPPKGTYLAGPVAWGHSAGHDLVAAAYNDDVNGRIGLWDPGTGRHVRTLTGHADQITALAWATSPAGQGVLASAGWDRTLRLWDPETGRELAAVHHPDRVLEVSLAVDTGRPPSSDGWTLLVAAGCADARARVYRVLVRGGRDAVAEDLAADESAEAGHVLAAAVPGLLALGGRGLWPPLGLVSDLVALTGPAGGAAPLGDPALAPLAAHRNVERLRDLGWPAPARAALVALLVGDLEHPARYTPPDAEPAVLDDALSAALDRRGLVLGPPSARAVQAGADTVTAADLNLLRILGAGACANDPTLPLRLRHVAALLPTMDPDALDLLATAAPVATPPAGPDRRTVDVPAPVSSPVVTDLARHGAPTRILHTELALPPKVFAHRLRHGQVLHRRTTHRQRPTPSPLTLVLDTTPATYGPVETLLRIVAHLLTSTLWGYGVRPALVTLSRPTTVTSLAEPAHLVHLWTSRSLATGADRIDVALRVAADLGQRTVLLTHHARAVPQAGDGLSIVTTHTPGTAAPPAPVDPRHHHLPPNPDAARLRELVATLADTGGTA